jgi:hypothetical protein
VKDCCQTLPFKVKDLSQSTCHLDLRESFPLTQKQKNPQRNLAYKILEFDVNGVLNMSYVHAIYLQRVIFLRNYKCSSTVFPQNPLGTEG